MSSISRSLTEGLGREGRKILGGDVTFSLIHREAGDAERAFLAAQGRVSSIATMRAMAIAGDKGSGLVELKAVDAAYPTVGDLVTEPAAPAGDLLAERDGAFGAIADPALLIRLDLKAGDRVSVGAATFAIRASLVSEPDKIASGVGFGPRFLVSQAALRATGLLQPGSLVRWTYRLERPAASSDADLERVAAAANKAFPEAGWEIRSRVNADPRFARNIERFSQFLTLVGLTALLVGGVGVANAVRGFVDRKRASIATLKSLGAPGGQVVALYLVQVLLIAAVGILIGLVDRCRPAVPGHGAVRQRAADPDRTDARAGRARARGALRRADGACLRDCAARPGARRAGIGPVPRPDRPRAPLAAPALSRDPRGLDRAAHRPRLRGRL